MGPEAASERLNQNSRAIVILTEARYERPVAPNQYVRNILHEEALVAEGLQRRGWQVERVNWARPGYNWRQVRAALFRSTWDYFDRFAEFSAWLPQASAQTRLLNSAAAVHWNVDKRYLLDLERRGVHLPATCLLEPGTRVTLAQLLAEQKWNEAVLKPAISGAARHTYRLRAANVAEHENVFQELLQHEAMLLQPFLPAVLEQGELSLMVIGGSFTHAVRKIGKPGDFRVQDDHGGTVHHHTATAEEIAFAEAAVAASNFSPLYARVDVVRGTRGELALMELELIEPELFFRFFPPAAEALAEAVTRELGGRPE